MARNPAGNPAAVPRTAAHPAGSSAGFGPVAGPGARVLVLGSLPGRASIAAGEYYAHPRNAFWPIMGDLVGAAGCYADRCACLIRHGIAVWDVLARSVRPGSLDADIRRDTAVCNDFDAFFREHAGLRLVCFNGRKAEQLFRRLVVPAVAGIPPGLALLPSTSPAHASLSYADKLGRWRVIIRPQLAGEQRR